MDLFGGSVPNLTEQGATDRIHLAGHSLGTRAVVGKQEIQAVNFDVVIDGQLSAQGTLWIASDTELPVQRVLYGRRPREMILMERYEVFRVDAGG
jgi:hypothetical protein